MSAIHVERPLVPQRVELGLDTIASRTAVPIRESTTSVDLPRAARHAASFTAALQLDPLGALMVAESRLRGVRQETQCSFASSIDERADAFETMRQVALERAREAAEEAKGFLGISGFLGDLLKGVTMAGAIAGAIASGGLGAAALAGVGVAVTMSAGTLAKIAVRLGVSEEAAQWMRLGLEIGGGLLASGAGLAGAGGSVSSGAVSVATSAGASVTRAATLVNAGESIAELAHGVEVAANIIAAATSAGRAGAELIVGLDERSEGRHRADAEELGVSARHEESELDALTGEIESEARASARVRAIFVAIIETQNEARAAACRALA